MKTLRSSRLLSSSRALAIQYLCSEEEIVEAQEGLLLFSRMVSVLLEEIAARASLTEKGPEGTSSVKGKR